jgi:enediyne polyketide synthase
MAVASPGRTVACDVERAAERSPQEWEDLLGKAQLDLTRLVTRESDESPSVAATRVWSAIEAAHKAGQPFQVPMTLAPRRQEGWVLFESGDMRIATFVTRLRDQEDPAVFAILTTSNQD